MCYKHNNYYLTSSYFEKRFPLLCYLTSIRCSVTKLDQYYPKILMTKKNVRKHNLHSSLYARYRACDAVGKSALAGIFLIVILISSLFSSCSFNQVNKPIDIKLPIDAVGISSLADTLKPARIVLLDSCLPPVTIPIPVAAKELMIPGNKEEKKCCYLHLK